MKRIEYQDYGGPEEMMLGEVEKPKPQQGQILVQVRAAAVNSADWKVRRGELKLFTGFRFPRGMGTDFAGIVEAVGPGVKQLKAGDAVFGTTSVSKPGSFAEFLVTDEENAVLKPASITFEQAAALPVVSITAWNALAKAKLSAGQSIFIAGCLGGVGRSAVQLALIAGASVAGSCGAAVREEALALGVGEVVDYRAFDVGRYRHRFDVVLDAAGALSLNECSEMLRPGGVSLHVLPTPAKILGCLFSSRHHLVFAKTTQASLTAIAEAAGQGRLVPAIGRVVPLLEAIPALTELETTGLTKGKLVFINPAR
jgi:NADPH:quinone reductase-like Zn-dependent oxidoreductase